MTTYRTATVAELLFERPGLQRVRLEWPEGIHQYGHLAFAVTQHVGRIEVGDQVVVNTTAVDLGLGTGGWHVVHWNLARSELHLPGGGHVMKLRYTGLQSDTGVVEEHEPEAVDAAGRDLGGMPVVITSVHSQVAAVAAAIHLARPDARVTFVMTDAAALPAPLSDLLADLRDRRWLSATVTTGHAFGGDHEAVNVASGLAVARHHGADVAVVGPGPGVVGTGTALGHSGIDAAGHLDLAAALGGRAILAARASSGDPRPRHQGLSHHTVAALKLAARPAEVAAPSGEAALIDQLRDARGPHRVVEVDAPLVGHTFAEAGMTVTTMGRSPAEDPLFFAAAAASGALAAG